MVIKHLLAGMILQGNGVFPSQGAFYWDDCTTPSWKLAAKALKNKQNEAGSSFLPFQGRAVHFREGTNIGTDEFPGLKIQRKEGMELPYEMLTMDPQKPTFLEVYGK